MDCVNCSLDNLINYIVNKYNINRKTAIAVYYKLRNQVKNKLFCETDECNRKILKTFIKNNRLYKFFNNLSNCYLDLIIEDIDEICGDEDISEPELGLRLGFKVDIANAPVADPTSVSDWNTFFNLPTNGTPFTSVIVAGLEAKLIGGGNLIVKPSAFQSSTAIDYVIDEAGVIIEIGDDSFGFTTMSEFTANSMTDAGDRAFYVSTIGILNTLGLENAGDNCFSEFSCTTFNALNIVNMGLQCFTNSTIAGAYTFNSLLTTGDSCFALAANITALTMSILTNLGSTVGDNGVFNGMTALTAVTVPTALATIDGGNPDGDLVYAVGTLGATITYV